MESARYVKGYKRRTIHCTATRPGFRWKMTVANYPGVLSFPSLKATIEHCYRIGCTRVVVEHVDTKKGAE